MSWQPVVSDSRLVEEAWSKQDRYKASWWDSLIVAAAQSASCRYLLSEDFQDGQIFDDLEVINPFRHEPESLFQPDE